MLTFTRRSAMALLGGASAGLVISGCEGDDEASTPATPIARSFRMGFSPNPPRATVQAVLQGIDLWSTRAELVIIHEELPWAKLLAGMAPDAIIDQDKQALVGYLRGKGLTLFFLLDLTNGLAREAESRELVAAGRSLTEPAVQALAREYALTVQRRLNPEYLGLAAETNLIRLAAPAAVYQAVKRVANDIDAALSTAGAASKRFISVQVETAWGRLGSAGPFVGIDQDYADFPFTQALGLSSYPYLAYSQPEDLPADYYSRLRGTRNLPVIVTEGGWASASLGAVTSSPQFQARYIDRHATLLTSVNASAYLQLQFADVDIGALQPPVPANLPLFGSIGLADSSFSPKPALARWDALFARPRT
jgi:hypothetical protein